MKVRLAAYRRMSNKPTFLYQGKGLPPGLLWRYVRPHGYYFHYIEPVAFPGVLHQLHTNCIVEIVE